MNPGSNSASTVADPQQSDQEFFNEKLIEFAVLKTQVLDRLKKLSGKSREFSTILGEVHDNTDTLFSNFLSVYGLILEHETKQN